MRTLLAFAITSLIGAACGTSEPVPDAGDPTPLSDADGSTDPGDAPSDLSSDPEDGTADAQPVDGSGADVEPDLVDTGDTTEDAVGDSGEDAPADVVEDAGDAADDAAADTDADADPRDVSDADAPGDVAGAPICAADDFGFPPIEDACTTDLDCAAVLHQVDCCGTEEAIGISTGWAAAFAGIEARCRDEYYRCRCATRPTRAQDGNVLTEDATLGVSCLAGRCRTHVSGVDPVDCAGARPAVFPEFDRSCSEASDCALVTHQTDCCGNSAIWGISAGEVGRFEAAETECRAEYPACDCPARQPVTDAGTVAADPDTVELMCRDRRCFSFVPL